MSDGVDADVAIVGAGIVGLATGLRLLERLPDLRVTILEQERDVAVHQSGHNSGVVHAGLYYAPGSLKARLCRTGKADLERFAARHGIPIEPCGKLVVATAVEERPRFEALRERAVANGVPGIEVLGPAGIRDVEPEAAGVLGLWSPTTAITDFARVARAIATEVEGIGATIRTDHRVMRVERRPDRVVLTTSRGSVVARHVIACAGVQADRVAAMTGDRPQATIVPFRGDYYTLTADARHLVRGLIYPVPDPRFPFLGVHFTRRIDGAVWAGPNAVLAFARNGYRRRDVDVRDLIETLTDRGFLRLGLRYWRTGAQEMLRDWSRRLFFAGLRRYLPTLREEQLLPGPSGVRAQLVRRDGTLVDDFVIRGDDRVLHVLNAPSPAATASLAIGATLATTATKRFGLAGTR